MELAWTAVLSKYYEDYANNASLDKWEYMTEGRLTAELSGTGTVSNFNKDDTNKEITLTYASNGKNKVYNMKITEDGTVIVVSGISLNKTSLKMNPGNTEQLTATLDDIEGPITWSSSATSVATVSDSGLVTAANVTARGTTTITATCSGKTATCTVVVGRNISLTISSDTTDCTVTPTSATAIEGDQVILSATPKSGYRLKGWYIGTSTDASSTDTSFTYTLPKDADYVASLTIQAQFIEASDAIGVSQYGKQVTLNASTINGQTVTDNWKIFYATSENVYLIYGNYYPTNALQNVNGSYNIKTFGAYVVYSNTDRNTLLNYLGCTDGEGLTDDTNWTEIESAVTGTGATFAGVSNVKAYGGPTLDMWAKSWSAKYPSDKVYTKRVEKSGWSPAWGYNVGLQPNPSSTYIAAADMNTKAGYTAGTALESTDTQYSNNMYYPHKGNSAWNSTYGYWLASPSANDFSHVLRVYCSGAVGGNGPGYTDYCVRPVVSIPTSAFNSKVSSDLQISESDV